MDQHHGCHQPELRTRIWSESYLSLIQENKWFKTVLHLNSSQQGHSELREDHTLSTIFLTSYLDICFLRKAFQTWEGNSKLKACLH